MPTTRDSLMKIKYKLKNIGENIFLCTINNHYDLCMTFCRSQEFYESPYKAIRGKNFKLLDFMSLYAKDSEDGVFTYPADWVGFNIPSNVLENLYYNPIQDINDYDHTVKEILTKIGKNLKTKDKRYYLIAAVPNDIETISHEIAHALYNLNKNYKKDMDALTDSIPKPIYVKLLDTLFALGYCKQVVKDEIQAYFSNDSYMFNDNLKLKDRKKLKKFELQYKSVYNKYKTSLKIKI